jgi:dipeptidyl aminopeptidase/acylaminoacyl peptidase
MDYYMEVSHQVNKYKGPEPASDAINIPLLVSNGYIVCRPNIYLNNFESGESALASINAAADYLSSQQWIDSTKIAITGHSFGGWITNYVVTHNNRFAAAIPAAGISNLIGDYNDRWSDGGISHQYYYRRGPFRFIKGLEADPKMYIDNSPILFTKNISTPILLIHNEEDNAVPVYNSHQLFGQLRSEGKPVWLIQYDNEMHTIENEENQLDAQQKVIGFLDHYLKDKEKPDWMSRYIGKE